MFSSQKLILAVLLSVFCFSAKQINAQQLLINGDMELWIPGCPYNTAPDNWNNFSTMLGPDQAGACAGTVQSHQGTSHMNLVWTDAGLREGAEQIVTGLVPGVMYKITFWAASNNGLYAAQGPGILAVFLDQTSIFRTPEIAFGAPWAQYEVEFTATSNSHTVGFQVDAGTTNSSGAVGVDEISLSPTVGIRDNMMHQLQIHPNPVNDLAIIDQGDYFVEDLVNVPMRIVNIVGQEVKSGTLSFSGHKAAVDVQDLDAGVYFMQLEIGSTSVVRKFMVK